jgi:REP element-mobilizing transposase RayT
MPHPGETLVPELLAYFITWTTYGTWLPGDDRGWVKRQRGQQPPDASLRQTAQARMTDSACLLSPEERYVVETAVADHCQLRHWSLHVVNCRSNHVHVVLSATAPPKAVRNQLKAWCTRKLKESVRQDRPSSPPQSRQRWWSERGSCRYLNDDDSLEAAIVYVRDFQ